MNGAGCGHGHGMDEIAPGLHVWIREHPNIGKPVSSYFLEEGRVALNPLLPEDGVEALRAFGGVDHVVLTNRHHVRDSDEILAAFGAALHVPEAGVQEVGRGAVGYGDGDELPGGGAAIAIGVLSPDETAIHFPGLQAVAVADGAIRDGDGPLAFVPDELIGDDPEPVKAGLRAAFGRIAEEQAPEHLLLAHGPPVIGGATEALLRFAAEG